MLTQNQSQINGAVFKNDEDTEENNSASAILNWLRWYLPVFWVLLVLVGYFWPIAYTIPLFHFGHVRQAVALGIATISIPAILIVFQTLFTEIRSSPSPSLSYSYWRSRYNTDRLLAHVRWAYIEGVVAIVILLFAPAVNLRFFILANLPLIVAALVPALIPVLGLHEWNAPPPDVVSVLKQSSIGDDWKKVVKGLISLPDSDFEELAIDGDRFFDYLFQAISDKLNSGQGTDDFVIAHELISHIVATLERRSPGPFIAVFGKRLVELIMTATMQRPHQLKLLTQLLNYAFQADCGSAMLENFATWVQENVNDNSDSKLQDAAEAAVFQCYHCYFDQLVNLGSPDKQRMFVGANPLPELWQWSTNANGKLSPGLLAAISKIKAGFPATHGDAGNSATAELIFALFPEVKSAWFPAAFLLVTIGPYYMVLNGWQEKVIGKSIWGSAGTSPGELGTGTLEEKVRQSEQSDFHTLQAVSQLLFKKDWAAVIDSCKTELDEVTELYKKGALDDWFESTESPATQRRLELLEKLVKFLSEFNTKPNDGGTA